MEESLDLLSRYRLLIDLSFKDYEKNIRKEFSYVLISNLNINPIIIEWNQQKVIKDHKNIFQYVSFKLIFFSSFQKIFFIKFAYPIKDFKPETTVNLKLTSLYIMIFEGTIKMQPKKDWPTFNIRKVQRKGLVKHPEQFGMFTPQYEFEKYPQGPSFTNPKRQKELMINYSVNQAILSSKAYTDLMHTYNENKRKNNEKKREVQEQIQRLKKQKEDAIQEERRFEMQRRKYEQLLIGLKERILDVRERNREAKEMIQHRMTNEADYLSNLLISMRFQAEYEHDIDPDQMTYEELLQLQEKIGSVSRGLPPELLEKLPSYVLQNPEEDQCTVCICGMEQGETITQLQPCGHKFHNECIKNWLSKEKICSLCKREVAIQP